MLQALKRGGRLVLADHSARDVVVFKSPAPLDEFVLKFERPR